MARFKYCWIEVYTLLITFNVIIPTFYKHFTHAGAKKGKRLYLIFKFLSTIPLCNSSILKVLESEESALVHSNGAGDCFHQ